MNYVYAVLAGALGGFTFALVFYKNEIALGKALLAKAKGVYSVAESFVSKLEKLF